MSHSLCFKGRIFLTSFYRNNQSTGKKRYKNSINKSWQGWLDGAFSLCEAYLLQRRSKLSKISRISFEKSNDIFWHTHTRLLRWKVQIVGFVMHPSYLVAQTHIIPNTYNNWFFAKSSIGSFNVEGNMISLFLPLQQDKRALEIPRALFAFFCINFSQ